MEIYAILLNVNTCQYVKRPAIHHSKSIEILMYFDQNRAKYERWFGIHDWDVLEWRANHVTENAKAT